MENKTFTVPNITCNHCVMTIKRELGFVPPRERLWDLLVEEFAEVLGPLEIETTVDKEWRAKTHELAAQFLTDEWLYRKMRPRAGRQVKIRAGVQVKQKMHKAPGGLIRATTEVQDGIIAAVALSGDFFFFPEEKLADLEAALVEVPVEEAEQAVASFYEEHGVESPGITPADFAAVVE